MLYYLLLYIYEYLRNNYDLRHVRPPESETVLSLLACACPVLVSTGLRRRRYLPVAETHPTSLICDEKRNMTGAANLAPCATAWRCHLANTIA